MSNTPIDTRRVAGRRKPRYESLDAAIADAERLAEAERLGTLRALGNWSLGQAIGHVAWWALVGLDGYPAEMARPPWFVRMALRVMKRRFLTRSVPAGVRVPMAPGGTYGTDPLPTDEALARLRGAFGRLAAESPRFDSALFGPMTQAEWVQFNLRHAELHLSFFVTQTPNAG